MEDSPYESSSADPGVVSVPTADERNWMMGSHLSALLGYTCIPFANIIAPLVIWQLKKGSSQLIEREALESLNFQITFTIALLVSGLLCVILIGFIILPIIYVVGIVFTVLGALSGAKGQPYVYPWTLRLVH